MNDELRAGAKVRDWCFGGEAYQCNGMRIAAAHPVADATGCRGLALTALVDWDAPGIAVRSGAITSQAKFLGDTFNSGGYTCLTGIFNP